MNEDSISGQRAISCDPFPGSRKIDVPGELHPVRVAMREIRQEDTRDTFTHSVTPNPPVTVYDTSGPYTDPTISIDVRKGLPHLREQWIIDRGDTEGAAPVKAKSGRIVTQLHYARKGIITAEMEYIAIRENQQIHQYT